MANWAIDKKKGMIKVKQKRPRHEAECIIGHNTEDIGKFEDVSKLIEVNDHKKVWSGKINANNMFEEFEYGKPFDEDYFAEEKIRYPEFIHRLMNNKKLKWFPTYLREYFVDTSEFDYLKRILNPKSLEEQIKLEEKHQQELIERANTIKRQREQVNHISNNSAWTEPVINRMLPEQSESEEVEMLVSQTIRRTVS